jgi:putative tryptophan/tyrosine transport system substrate-binding protein
MRRRKFSILLGGALTASTARGFAAHAQKATPVIGYLYGGVAGYSSPDVAAFRRGLDETGYVEGQKLAIEYRWAEGRYNRLPSLAADLVSRKVDVIAAIGVPAVVLAAKDATSTIPIVFVTGGDPVGRGLVASLARPGGNVTGVTILVADLAPKLLELLSELVPQAKAIALLRNPTNSGSEPAMRNVQEAAPAKWGQVQVLEASSESEIDAAFGSLAQRQADALLVLSDQFFFNRRAQIVALAARHAVPTIYEFSEYARAGGLISYGASLPAASRQAGTYAGKILKGAKAADLPVLQPTTFELVINLKTAKALGLAIPTSILSRADEVIE